MKIILSTLCAAAAVIALAVVPARLEAQSKGVGKITRMADGKPDFTGIYEWPKSLGGEACTCSATIFDRKFFAPLKPGGENFAEPRTGDPKHDEPRDFCMPAGFPAGMLSANAMQFFQTGAYLTIVHEFQRMTRIIPLDGRPFREDIEPTFYGDSVGHWEGDTLVIESQNFKRWTLDDYFYKNAKEFRMHSDALRTTERMTWKDSGAVSYKLTIDDPKTFSAPWSQDFEFKAKPEWDKTGLYEYVCLENNRCPGGKCGN
jgi:hypothetical protein